MIGSTGKALIALALACALMPFAPEQTGAHQGSIVFPIFEIPSSDLPNLHDNTLEDWDAILPDASLTHNDFEWTANAAGAIEVEDLAFRVFLAWHGASQRIFVGYEAFDDIYYSFVGEDFSLGNGWIRFAIDGDHSGGKYFYFQEDGYSEEQSQRLTGSQAQTYTVRAEVQDGRYMTVASWAFWSNESPWSEVGTYQFGESPNHTVLEFSITPWDDLNLEGPEESRRSVLEAGRVIGFNFSVTDFDDSNAPDGFYNLVAPVIWEQVSEGEFSHSGFAENFVDGELVPCNRGDCGSAPDEETAVGSVSWGRIKASFR